MKLKEYLDRCKVGYAEFADLIGCSRMHLSRILGGYAPSKKLAKKIEETCQGEVTVLELLFPEEPSPPKGVEKLREALKNKAKQDSLSQQEEMISILKD